MLETPTQAFVEIEHPLLNTTWKEKLGSHTAKITFLDFVQMKSEKSDEPVQLGLAPQKMVIETATRNIASEVNVTEFKETTGLDATGLILGKHIESLTNETTTNLSKIYESLGELRRKKHLTKLQTFYEKYIGKLPVYALTPDDLLRKCALYGNLIAVNSRRGSADFIIAGNIIGQYFGDNPAFVYSNAQNSYFLGSPIYEFGQINGMKVFINSQMDNHKIVLGRNTRKGDLGVGFFESGRVFDIVQLPDQEKAKYVLRSDDAIAVIPDEAKASANYYSFNIKIAKRPFWKKWLRL